MGNSIPPGIPPLLARNWQPVPDHPNSFRNKLTNEYTHKHIINVEDPTEIQLMKLRMKQTNLYICRVLFYHQYHESIYHVYTDEIHMQPNLSKIQLWKLHKIKIVQSFARLAEVYGFMKVCRQMIGADTNGHPKIWIHPDPVCSKPWTPCNSQSSMLSDILNILSTIQQRHNSKSKKILNKSAINTRPYIRQQTQLLSTQNYQTKNRHVNRTSNFIQTNTYNYINISHQQQSKKKNQNKQNIVQSKNSKNFQSPKNYQPKYSTQAQIQQYYNHQAKVNKLQKLFNPVVCQTSRDQELKNKKFKQYVLYSPNGKDRSKNLSMERPVTYHLENMLEATKRKNDINKTTYTIDKKSIPKRRQTSDFKNYQILHTQGDHQSNKQDMSKASDRPKFSNLTYEQYRALQSKSPQNKIINNPKKHINNSFHSPHNRQNKINDKIYQHNQSYQLKQNRPQSNQIALMKNKIITSKKQIKHYNMPNFLLKSNAELIHQNWSGQAQKYSSTERNITKQDRAQKYPKQMQRSALNVISTKSIEQDSDDIPNTQPTRPRQHTHAPYPRPVPSLKQQLNFILESPIEPDPEPINPDYENFKASQMLYRPSHYQDQFQLEQDYEQEKDEINMIKEKVEEKKARFAQLKLDAKKILQDDF